MSRTSGKYGAGGDDESNSLSTGSSQSRALEALSVDQNTVVTGGTFYSSENMTFNYVHPRNLPQKEGINTLLFQVTPGTVHESLEQSPPPQCPLHIQKAIQRMILAWAKDKNALHRIIWLCGPAGSGKTNLLCGIARDLKKKGILGAEFFYPGHSSGGLSISSKELIPTLAYRLAQTIPQFGQHVSLAMEINPGILMGSMEGQFHTLVIQPLESSGLDASGLKSRVVIIDGLDHLQDPKTQGQIIHTISSAVHQSSFPLIFLVSSTPEKAIRNAFNSTSTSSVTRCISINDTYSGDSEIKGILLSRFEDIKRRHPLRALLPPIWPDDNILDILVKKTSGQTTYALTIAAYIFYSPIGPDESLSLVLSLMTESENHLLGGLDRLYYHIFSTLKNFKAEAFKLLSYLIFKEKEFYTKFAPTNEMESFLDLGHGRLQATFSDLRAVLQSSFAESSATTSGTLTPTLCPELSSFLLDKARSGVFFIDDHNAHTYLARCCLRYQSKTRSRSLHNDSAVSIIESPTNYSYFLRYSVEYLSSHLVSADVQESISHDVHNFSFPDWFNQLFDPKFSMTRRLQYGRLQDLYRLMEDFQTNLFLQVRNSFDIWLRSRLDRYPMSAFFRLLLSLFTLDLDFGRDSLIEALTLYSCSSTEYEKFVRVDEAQIGLIEALSIRELYYPMLSGFLLDRIRGGKYHIDDSTLFELSKSLVSFLRTDPQPRPSSRMHHDDINWAPSSPEIVAQFGKVKDGRAFAALQKVFARVPLDHSFSIFLEQNPIQLDYHRFMDSTTLPQFYAVNDAIKSYIDSSYKRALVPGSRSDSSSTQVKAKFKAGVRRLVFALRLRSSKQRRSNREIY